MFVGAFVQSEADTWRDAGKEAAYAVHACPNCGHWLD